MRYDSHSFHLLPSFSQALSSCDTEAILQACPNLSQLAIRGGICAGPLFLRLSLCSLVALELTGCLSRQREQFESLCCLTALTKLSLTLAKGRTILLRDLTPFFARLPLLSDLHVAGLELYKQVQCCMCVGTQGLPTFSQVM